VSDLQARLDVAVGRLYVATPASNRAAMVMDLLADPLSEVRLVGLRLATERVANGEPVADGVAAVVRSLLSDRDVRVRTKAALLAADLADPEAVELIMARLDVEVAVEARTALIAALGALGDDRAVDVLLTALVDEPDEAAIEAALALERMVGSVQLTEQQTTTAVAVITERYAENSGSPPRLRRALLSAMRAVDRPEFAAAMRSALADPVATIRLEAIRGLQTLQGIEPAADIAPLAADPDRGVRQAAVTTLGALGDPTHLPAVLARTNADAEPDPVVRQHAWDTALALVAQVDDDRLAKLIADLADRPDALEYRIRMLETLVDRLADDESRRTRTRLQLAEALLAAHRTAEAADILAGAHAEAADSSQADEVWLAWIKALLAAEDLACLTHMAGQEDADLFDDAVELLLRRLADLNAAQRYSPLLALADAAAERLADRLDERVARRIRALQTDAAQRRQAADRDRIARLIASLADAEAAQRDEAAASLRAMGKRAVEPMVRHLRNDLNAEKPNAALQQRLVELLGQLDAELTGFDEAADVAEKVKLVDQWLAQLGS